MIFIYTRKCQSFFIKCFKGIPCFFDLDRLQNKRIIIFKMINGVCLSQIEDVNLSKISHYRRISQIENGSFTKFSQMEPHLMKIVRNKKQNHEKWKNYQRERFTTEIRKGNSTYRSKLAKIKMGKSVYSLDKKNQTFSPKHSNFYQRRKIHQQIINQNPLIARSIINARGSLDHTNTRMDYNRYRQQVSRLQKFQAIQRMTVFSQNRKKIKTLPDQKTQKIKISPITNQLRYNWHSPKRINQSTLRKISAQLTSPQGKELIRTTPKRQSPFSNKIQGSNVVSLKVNFSNIV